MVSLSLFCPSFLSVIKTLYSLKRINTSSQTIRQVANKPTVDPDYLNHIMWRSNWNKHITTVSTVGPNKGNISCKRVEIFCNSRSSLIVRRRICSFCRWLNLLRRGACFSFSITTFKYLIICVKQFVLAENEANTQSLLVHSLCVCLCTKTNRKTNPKQFTGSLHLCKTRVPLLPSLFQSAPHIYMEGGGRGKGEAVLSQPENLGC